MYTQRTTRYLASVLGVLVALATVPSGVVAHLGESSHIHSPAQRSTPISTVWCVRFSEDPGTWRPEGESSVKASLLGDGSIVFLECVDILEGDYAIETFEGGEHVRTTVPGPPLGEAPTEALDAPVDAGELISIRAWTKHQRKWLQKGDRLGVQLGKATTLPQFRRVLGSIQRHFKGETTWLRRNADRFAPDSCIEADRTDWAKRVKQAQKNINKTATALKRGNVAALIASARQYQRAYTKVEQIYSVGRCESLG